MSKLEESIKSKIKNKKPIPKWQCTSYKVIYDLIVLGLWIISVFGFGMLVYILSQIELEAMPNNFIFYWQSFLGLPWEIIIIFISLVIVIYFLSKKMFFLYRINPLIILTLICLSILCGYFASEKMGANNSFAKNQIIQNIYKKQGKLINPHRGIIWIGNIVKDNNQFLFTDVNGRIYNIKFENEKLKDIFNKMNIDTRIKVIGTKENNTIKTYSIKKINNFRGFPFIILQRSTN